MPVGTATVHDFCWSYISRILWLCSVDHGPFNWI